MLVLGSEDWQQRLQLLLEDFHKQCRRFYRAEHLQAGCFIATDRQGRRQEFALLSLSIGVVQLHPQACAGLDAGQLAELASQAKHQAKDVPGHSLYLIDTAPAVQASSCSG
ncbi:hypothetical protein D3C79_728910 [compost metagenome]